jgi:hypothetical protein
MGCGELPVTYRPGQHPGRHLFLLLQQWMLPEFLHGIAWLIRRPAGFFGAGRFLRHWERGHAVLLQCFPQANKPSGRYRLLSASKASLHSPGRNGLLVFFAIALLIALADARRLPDAGSSLQPGCWTKWCTSHRRCETFLVWVEFLGKKQYLAVRGRRAIRVRVKSRCGSFSSMGLPRIKEVGPAGTWQDGWAGVWPPSVKCKLVKVRNCRFT